MPSRISVSPTDADQRSVSAAEKSHFPSAEAEREILTALKVLKDDGIVAFATETVWGLAARARSKLAVEALRGWKGRSETQPISLLVSQRGAVTAEGIMVSPRAEHLMDCFWPGPLTLVLPSERRFADGIARVDGAVGVRCSAHPSASQLAIAAEAEGLGPLTATSLNRRGEPPAVSEPEAREFCATDSGNPHLYFVSGHDAHGGLPSTVLDLAVDPPAILRDGAIDKIRLRSSWEHGPKG